MKSHYPHPVDFADQIGYTASHLSGSLVGKCYGKYAAWVYPLLYHICHAVSHRRRLSRSGACKYQERSVNMPYRLILFTV